MDSLSPNSPEAILESLLRKQVLTEPFITSRTQKVPKERLDMLDSHPLWLAGSQCLDQIGLYEVGKAAVIFPRDVLKLSLYRAGDANREDNVCFGLGHDLHSVTYPHTPVKTYFGYFMNDEPGVFEAAFEKVKDCFKGGGYEFPIEFLDSAHGPVVYLFHRDAEVLYVGFSANGLKRPISQGHQEAERARLEATRLSLYPCVSEDAARTVEAVMIFALKPKYNLQGRMGSEILPDLLGVTRDSFKEVYSGDLLP